MIKEFSEREARAAALNQFPRPPAFLEEVLISDFLKSRDAESDERIEMLLIHSLRDNGLSYLRRNMKQLRAMAQIYVLKKWRESGAFDHWKHTVRAECQTDGTITRYLVQVEDSKP